MGSGEQHTSTLVFAEHVLARAGYVVLSPEMSRLLDGIEARLRVGATVPSAHFEAFLYAVYASPYGDYHRAQELA
ncbi:hypothetical protein CV770_03950 [Bradyrhizobium sp. AC87j1]|nr:hypothetical protein CV770_03950 [Bradyrhizobium sp. AC87j1]